MKKFLFFDTETTGFPPKARMTQLAFMLVREDGEIIDSFKSLIKPDGWEVPKEKFFIDNNMSTERCEAEGIPVFDALRRLQDCLKLASIKVAHNINFDNKIILKELEEAKITHQLFQFKKGFCTMATTTEFCKLPGRYGKPKWPKLLELHKILFGAEFDGAHDAMADVRATKDCFFELIKRGIIKIN